MIATTRGLAILAAIAVALLALALVPGTRRRGPIDRSLLAQFDDTAVTALTFSRPGQPAIRLTRAGTDWRWETPPGLADPARVDAVLTALRGGRWHRRAPAATAGPARAELQVGGTTLSVRNELPGTGQTWIVRGSDALLVDSWIAAALAPEPLDLRVRHPLACSGSITATTPRGTLRIDGARLVEPRPLWLDDRWRQTLASACTQIEIVALDGTRDGRTGLHVVADGELTEVGACERGRALVDTSSGAGCVEIAALRTLAEALRDPAPELRPLPIDPAKLTLPDGAVVDVTARRVADVDADPDRVRELVTALSTRGTAAPRPAGKPTATIAAVDRAGTEVVLELFAKAIARRGEDVAIAIGPDAWAVITRPSSALRDPVRWREDATNITAITLDHVTYSRGAVLGEWTREPAGSVDPTLVEALVETLATVRAPAAPPPAAIAHRLRITITPPAGAPITHAIELAAPTSDGCAARLDGAPVRLSLPLCTAATALASSR